MAFLRILDNYFERTVLTIAFFLCAGIVAEEVFRRYVFSTQAPWSTYVTSYLFLWITYLGASYSVKLRIHLNFGEIRALMPRTAQYWMLQLDYVLFIVFSSVVIYYSVDLLGLQMDNESIVPGTDNVMAWWFYTATPVGFTLVIIRVIQNAIGDYRDLKSGAPIRVKGQMLAHD